MGGVAGVSQSPELRLCPPGSWRVLLEAGLLWWQADLTKSTQGPSEPKSHRGPERSPVPWIAHRKRDLPHPLLPLSTKGGALSLASRKFQPFPIPFTLAGVSPVLRGRPWRGGQGDGLGARSWGVPQPVDAAVPPRGSRTVTPTFITFITWGRRV